MTDPGLSYAELVIQCIQGVFWQWAVHSSDFGKAHHPCMRGAGANLGTYKVALLICYYARRTHRPAARGRARARTRCATRAGTRTRATTDTAHRSIDNFSY